jgi:hypothetical protein
MSEQAEIIHPLKDSMSGRNAFYHFCDTRGAHASYAVCLHTITAIEENRIKSDQFIECQRACTHDTCPAKKMRAEEKAAGKALYFKERTNINPANTRSETEAQASALSVSSGKYDLNNPSYARGWAQVGSTKKSDQESGRKAVQHKPAFKNPAQKPKPADGYVTEGMADLVNVLMKEEKKPSPAPLALKPEPGESPLAFAKRRAQAMQAMKEAQ